MTGKRVEFMGDWTRIFHRNSAILMTPGILTGLALIAVTTKYRHFAVLPCCLLVIPAVFHIILLISNVSAVCRLNRPILLGRGG